MGLFGLHAGGDVFGDLLVEMKLELGVQPARHVAATEESLEVQPQSSSEGHAAS